VPTGISTFAIERQFIEKDTYHVEASQNADRTGITVSEREIVLKVKADGTIASVRLSADAEQGSEINIIADQVKINDVRFERLNTDIGTGLIESTNYETGVSGWRIDGTGRAEFENVVARGEIIAESGSLGNLDVEGNVTVSNGTILWDGGKLDNDGILLDYNAYLSNIGSGINWSNATNLKSFIASFDAEGVDSLRLGVASDSGTILFNIGTGLDPEQRPSIGKQSIKSKEYRVGEFDLATIQYSGGENRTYTIPDIGANGNFVITEGTQTINGNKTFGNVVVVPNATNGTHAVNRTTGDARYLQTSNLAEVGSGVVNDNTRITISFNNQVYLLKAELI